MDCLTSLWQSLSFLVLLCQSLIKSLVCYCRSAECCRSFPHWRIWSVRTSVCLIFPVTLPHRRQSPFAKRFISRASHSGFVPIDYFCYWHAIFEGAFRPAGLHYGRGLSYFKVAKIHDVYIIAFTGSLPWCIEYLRKRRCDMWHRISGALNLHLPQLSSLSSRLVVPSDRSSLLVLIYLLIVYIFLADLP